MQELGERLAELRKDYGYTQDYIAELLNVTRSSISAYETGVNDPSLENLITLANLYNVSLDYLCCRTRDKINLNLSDKESKEFIVELCKFLETYAVHKK